MSIWTHVEGAVRIDSSPFAEADGELGDMIRIAKIFGETWEYDSPSDQIKRSEESDMPSGGEGSLQYKIINTAEKNDESGGSTAVWTVVIWGDLRSFESKDLPKIKAWCARIRKELCWTNAMAKSSVLPLSLRGGILHAHVEGGEELIYRFTNDGGDET